VADNTTPIGKAPSGQPMTSLGYPIGSDSSSISFTINDVSEVNKAKGSILVLNYSATSQATLTYTVNGHANVFNNAATVQASAGSDEGAPSQTIALPVPLAELRSGDNAFTVGSPDGSIVIANVDLILQAAGGIIPAG
jgi:hypothetical protein